MSITKKLGPAMAAGLAATFCSSVAFAQEAGGEAAAGGLPLWAPIGAGIAIGLGVLGGGTAQGKAASTALEGIARNPGAAPKIQTPMILGLALIESLVLFSLVIAMMILGKI